MLLKGRLGTWTFIQLLPPKVKNKNWNFPNFQLPPTSINQPTSMAIAISKMLSYQQWFYHPSSAPLTPRLFPKTCSSLDRLKSVNSLTIVTGFGGRTLGIDGIDVLFFLTYTVVFCIDTYITIYKWLQICNISKDLKSRWCWLLFLCIVSYGPCTLSII